MQTTTLSCFRFDTRAAKAWAFTQMQFARGPLKRTPGVSFCKLMGSGAGESFDPKPNFGVYAILLVWPSDQAARDGLASSPVLARYRDMAAESLTLRFAPLECWGAWDGTQPFAPIPDAPSTAAVQPLGVLTRATLRTSALRDFWASVPDVSADTAGHPDILFKLGMGEIPWVHQVTISIWTDAKAMRAFAYKSGAHADAIRKARDHAWFKEDLFARFSVLGCEGTWSGRHPLAAFTPAEA